MNAFKKISLKSVALLASILTLASSFMVTGCTSNDDNKNGERTEISTVSKLPTESQTAEQSTTTEATTTTTVTTTEQTTAATTVTTTEATTATTKPTTTAATTQATTTTAKTTATSATAAVSAVSSNISSSDEMRDISTAELVDDMGIGINLGNTFDSCGDWIDQWGDGTPRAYETAWGSPVVTEKMIKGYADAGFGVMRLPVTWSNLMKEDGTLSNAYIDRVKQVVDWILDNGMYCILNMHHEGWIGEDMPEDYEGTLNKYAYMWEQIADAFKDYGDRLMFESMNEIGFDSLWNRYGGTSGKSEAYKMFNSVNRKFVDVVRASGGNNPERHLLIAGYWTDIGLVCDSLFIMPNDPANRMAISVHYYSPATFAILEEDADWGKVQTTWGTAADKSELNNNMQKMKTWYSDKGIPVIVGEYGATSKNKTRSQFENYILSVATSAVEHGLCPILCDTPGGEYDRTVCKFTHEDFIEKLVSLK